LFNDIISSAVHTISAVLEEWEHGRNGNPSVAYVEEKWHTKWRKGQKQQKAYSRRKLLYNLIMEFAKKKNVTH
jgi:hypothetical protein